MLPVIEQLLVLQDRDRRLLRLRAELAAARADAGRLAKAVHWAGAEDLLNALGGSDLVVTDNGGEID